ncbi:MAG: hypothetical protein ACKOTZ_03045 [Chloroflexota bacterium]
MDDIAGPGSLFDGDETCYGGGGATARQTANGQPVIFGTATCGAGAYVGPDAAPVYQPVRKNSGGGAGHDWIFDLTTPFPDLDLGADGIVVFRYQVALAGRTAFALVDRSGSILAEKAQVVADDNAALAGWKTRYPGASYDLTLFDSQGARRRIVDRSIDDVRPLDAARLGGGGNTPLYDTVAAQIGRLRRIDPAGKVTFAIVTDGWDNASTRWTEARLARLIHRTEQDAGWRFVYLGASLAGLRTAVAALD